MSERALTDRIVKALRKAHGSRAWIMKVHGSGWQTAGIPDLLVCLDGRFIALEIKLPGGSHGVTPLQVVRLDQIRIAGGVAKVVRSVEDALDVLAAEDQAGQT